MYIIIPSTLKVLFLIFIYLFSEVTKRPQAWTKMDTQIHLKIALSIVLTTLLMSKCYYKSKP